MGKSPAGSGSRFPVFRAKDTSKLRDDEPKNCGRPLASLIEPAAAALSRRPASGDFQPVWSGENIERISGFPEQRFLEEPSIDESGSKKRG
jgi:hypothetical protein